MTEAVLSIDLQSPASEVLRLFSGYPVHHLPVVQRGKVVGMLGASDLLKLKSFLPRLGSNPMNYLNEHIRIDQVMRQPPITVRPHESIEAAAMLMAEHGIHALAVTDDDENLVGIITTTDIIYAALHIGGSEEAGTPQGLGGSGRPLRVRVSPREWDEALRLANANATSDDDKGKLAKALLHAQEQLRMLENVLACADRYVHAGQDQQLHSLLIRAIARAREPSSEVPLGL